MKAFVNSSPFSMKKFLGFLGCWVGLLGGCANPLNIGHYERYMDGGADAERAGDYQFARKCYARAQANAEVGFLGKAAESAAYYNWARMTGMLGDFAEAERGFKQALKLEEEVYGPGGGHASMRWFELARLYFAWGRYQDSVTAYEQGFPLADRKNIQQSDPVTYAAVVRDFAAALEKAGQAGRAQQERERAASIADQPPKTTILYYPTKISQ
ncbi:MAG: tetratricopeptide repeat protein [Verrucomicrobia bacterium]|nr:tetratricopeptide repeat protein [Verrucomicrobiota bacterium]